MEKIAMLLVNIRTAITIKIMKIAVLCRTVSMTITT